MSGIWGIVLAAGESKRMGSPKMILPYRNTTILGRVIENVLASGVEEILVVLGSNRDKVQEALKRYPVMHCFNGNYRSGMLSSVKCGFEHLPAGFNAAIVFLGDQPMVDASVVQLMIKAYSESGKGIVIPVYKNKRGHPLLVDRKYKDEILKLDEPLGLRGLADRHPDDMLEVETTDSSILKDIDTEEEYRNELKKEI